MKNVDLVELFRFHDLFEKKIILKRGEILKHAHTVDTTIYFVEKGSLKIYILDADEERIVRFGYQNNLIASLDSFLSGNPSDFYISAIKSSVIWSTSKARFMEFLENHPQYQKIWTAILEDLVLQQIEREKDLLTSSPKERYERVAKRSKNLFQEIPEKHIANYLRMSPETLSRLKKS